MTSPVSSAPSLLGRLVEIGWLDDRVREAASGSPRLVLLNGEPGIGKTRILVAIDELARRAGFRVGRGRSVDGGTTLLPILQATHALIRDARAAGDRIEPVAWQRIARLTQDARDTLSDRAESATDLPSYFSLAEALIEAAHEEPVALLLDDLHWADQPTLNLIETILFLAIEEANKRPLALLIVATLRPAPPASVLRAVARLQREGACATLDVRGLDQVALRALLSEHGVPHPSHQLLGVIERATEGNPLFVQQVLHNLQHSKALVERHGSMVLANPGLAAPIPADLRSAISERFEKTPPASREILRFSSILGDSFDPYRLVQVSGVAEETVFSALDEGLASGVLETRGDLVGFVSPLYRQVLCEEMNPLRRRRLHARIGNLIADEPGAFDDGRVMEIAQHWMEAGGEVPAERRLAATRGAAKRAAVLEDWHAATLFVEAALAASAGIPGLSPSVQAEMHQEAALAHHRNVDVGPCLHHYDCAAECFRQAQDVRGMTLIRMWELRARFTLASVAYGTLPDVAPLEAHCDEIEPGDPALRARALSTLAEAYWHGRQSDRAAALATEAMVLARQAEDPGAVAQALHVKALVHAQRLELREAVEAWRSALDEARQAKDVRLAGWPLQRLPLALTCLGEIEEAERAAQEAQSATQRELDWGQLSLVLASRSSLALVRGELDAVEGYAREAMRMTRRSGYPWGGAVALSALAVSRTLRGDADAAEDALELLARPGGAFEVPGPGVQLVVRVQRAHAHALVAAAEGRSYDAPPDLEAQIRLLCIAASDVNVLGALCAATETAALCHRDDLVAKLGASLAESAERGILLSNGAVFLLPRILAIADISAGRVGEARTRLAAAAAVAEAIGARVELTRTRLDQALLEAETGGDLQAAQAWAGEALQLGRELGLELIVRRALRCLSQLGDRSHALEVETSLEPLNPQQVRILLALSQGRTDAQTADDLLLSPATLARSLDRLDRAAAAARTGPSVAGDTVVIAVTDLVRSTDLMEERGERAALDLFRAHHARIRACIRRYGGFEIDEMGDGFLVGFHDATKAIAFARSSHAAIRDLAEQLDGAALRLRIGLHAGEPLAREGRKIFGAAVTGAVRICAAAQPDETLVSDRVRTLANAEKETFASRGTYVLKGFREPYELHAVQDSARAELARS